MTTARDPQKKKRAPSKGRVLLWAGVFLLNFVLLTAAVSLALFPQAGPLTAERLALLPYFEGCVSRRKRVALLPPSPYNKKNLKFV